METRISPRSSRLTLTADGRALGVRGSELKVRPAKNGYLTVCYSTDSGRSKTGALHVLVCEAFHGKRPEGMVVRHLNGRMLDNRAENLQWGTPAQNYADRDAHGGTARGERQGLSKLTDANVLEIRKQLSAGVAQSELAVKFGVSDVAVSNIGKGRTWTHLPVDETYREGMDDMRGENNGNSRLTAHQVLRIRAMLAAGTSQRSVAREFGVSQPLISAIHRRKTWAHLPAATI